MIIIKNAKLQKFIDSLMYQPIKIKNKKREAKK